MSIITTTDKQIFTADTEMMGVSSNLSEAYIRVIPNESGDYSIHVMVGDQVVERFYTKVYPTFPKTIALEISTTVTMTRVYHREIEFHSVEEYEEYKADPEFYISMHDTICDTEDFIDETGADVCIDDVEEI